jgi:hypothetical protein
MTKSAYTLLALLALPLLAVSQTEASSKRRVALTVSPNIAYLLAKEPVGEQTPRLGFHTRLDGEIKLKEHFWLRVGAGWSLLRYKTDIGKTLQWPSQVNAQGQYDPSLPGEKLIVLREENMLTIPVALRYYFGKKQRFYADLETGGSIIFVKSADARLRPNVGIAAGWQTAIGRQTWLFVQPSFRLVIDNNPILKNGDQHPASIGLELGVRRGW